MNGVLVPNIHHLPSSMANLCLSATSSANLIRMPSWLDQTKEARRWLEDRREARKDDWFATA